jgi:hypothetical protein
MATQDSSFNLEEIKIKMNLIGASGATQDSTQEKHNQKCSTSKVFGASNDRPVDGTHLAAEILEALVT